MDISFNSPVTVIECTGVKRSAIINAVGTILTRAIVCVGQGRSSFLWQRGMNLVPDTGLCRSFSSATLNKTDRRRRPLKMMFLGSGGCGMIFILVILF